MDQVLVGIGIAALGVAVAVGVRLLRAWRARRAVERLVRRLEPSSGYKRRT